jgi:hypothetical protein
MVSLGKVMASSIAAPTANTSLPLRIVGVLRLPAVVDNLALLLILCQLLDGLATAAGMHRFGVSFEGNFLLRETMKLIGVIPTLLLAKGAAIGMTIGLRRMGSQVMWVGEALLLLCLVYISAAIVPWFIILTR